MPELFELYGLIKGDTSQFEKALRNTDIRLTETSKNILATEKYAESLGKTTATSARSFEKLIERLGSAKSKFTDVSSAFQRGEATAKQMASAILSVERATQQVNSRLKDTEARLTDLKNKSSNLSNVLNTLPVGSFLGGGVAGISTAVFSEAINLTKQLASATFDAGIAAIKMGASYQRTVSSLAVFAGSTAEAKRELKGISDLAFSTAGLRLVSAEQGYQRLRAVGFNENLARGLVKEIGEEKILSGADDEAVQRVLFNFTQIATGGQKVSQEMREIITQIPTFQRIFADAFGTTDPKGIQKFFDEDTEGAFKRLLDSMSKGKTVAGGLSDALGKLEDTGIQLGRKFSEPILNPLTESVKNFTELVKSSESSIVRWGEKIADIIAGVNQLSINSGGSFIVDGTIDVLRKFLRDRTGGISESVILGVDLIAEAGKQIREFNKPLSAGIGIDSDSLAKADAGRVKLFDDIRERNQSLASRDFKVAEQILSGNAYDNKQQEVQALKSLGKLRSDYLSEQIKETLSFYDKLFKSKNLSDEEIEKREKQKNEELRKLNLDYQINQIKTQQDVARKEKEILEERKREQERLAKLSQSFSRFRASSLADLADSPYQKLALEGKQSAEDAFDRFKDLGVKQATEAADLVRKTYKDKIKKALSEQAFEVKNLIASLAGEAAQNPFVKLFVDGEAAIRKSIDATKGLNKEMRDLAVRATQFVNQRNLLNTRIDTALTASNQRFKGQDIAFPNPFRRFLEESDLNERLNSSDFKTRIGAQADLFDRNKTQEYLNEQFNLITNANTAGIDGLLAEQVKNSRLVSTFEGVNPSEIPDNLRYAVSQAFFSEAGRTAQLEAEVMKLAQNFNQIVTNLGLKVDLGGQFLTEVSVKSDDLSLEKKSTVTRPTRNDSSRAINPTLNIPSLSRRR